MMVKISLGGAIVVKKGIKIIIEKRERVLWLGSSESALRLSVFSL